MTSIFCCPGFKNLIENAGQTGPAAIVVWRSNQLRFLLQSRGVAYEDEAGFKTRNVPIRINVSSTVGLQYCLFCGRRLRELLETSPAEYAELATKHKPFETISIP